MTYLLDTHILIWLAEGSPKLKPHIIEVLENPTHTIKFSPVNLWEIAIKQSSQLQKSTNNLPIDYEIKVDINHLHEQLIENDFLELPVFSRHAKLVKSLPFHHKDPFDRLLIAQAISENICLITHDEAIWQYTDIQILKA